MITVAYSRNYESPYAGEFLVGMFKNVSFLRYKQHNIAIVGVEIEDGEQIEITEFTERRLFWNRVRPPVIVTYKSLKDSEIVGTVFDIYEVV